MVSKYAPNGEAMGKSRNLMGLLGATFGVFVAQLYGIFCKSERDNKDCQLYITHCNTIIILHLNYGNQGLKVIVIQMKYCKLHKYVHNNAEMLILKTQSQNLNISAAFETGFTSS